MNQLNAAIGKFGSLFIIERSGFVQFIIYQIIRKIKRPIIYVALIKPSVSILSGLHRNKIKTDKLFFIDCTTESASGVVERKENILFIKEPTDLTSIGIAVSQFLETIPGEKYLIIDALRILMIYHNMNVILKFIRSILEEASRRQAKVIILATKSKDTKLINKVSQFFEKVIEV